ncbi:hypothetical protein DWY45_11555 [Phocaeicola plebeius]|uniref:Uncharacterized protein n=1 Tax=Phocaeicola plebeius TaxID=310297 RepID=A0A414RAC0_9BACT|nr:hypothetical protein DWY45_11555 [Phocaeicola plebeius]RHF90000.1 hypothetical protein DW653_09895 [Phocaeicola plebeius]
MFLHFLNCRRKYIKFLIIPATDIQKISGITSKNGRNDAKRLNIRVVTVSNDDKPKNRKTQRKADLRRRMVCKSLPVKE